MAINRKSYIIYQTAPFSMTLNDPYPQFQDNAIIFDAEYLRNGTGYRHSCNGILIESHALLNNVISNDLK